MKRILKPTGSIYVHCDPTASHYLKIVLDHFFGYKNSRNEIVWCYTGPSNAKRDFARKHDTILRYAMGSVWTFNVDAIRIPYNRLNTQTSGGGIGGNLKGELRENLLKRGKTPETWWSKFSPVGRLKNERTGYPTQKPLALLERIIRASSNEGGVVLDPFCGCATTCVAAEGLDRQWAGIDISHKAAELVRMRLQQATESRAGGPMWSDNVVHRTDLPRRTDLGRLPRYTVHKNALYGESGGHCGGCGEHFFKRNLTVDHIVPQSKGGTDHPENLWLLCGACNSSKGTKSQAEFLRDRMSLQGAGLPWLDQ